MTQETRIGLLLSIVSGALLAIIDLNGVVSAFSEKPVQITCSALLMFGLGFLCCSIYRERRKDGIKERKPRTDRAEKAVLKRLDRGERFTNPTARELDVLRSLEGKGLVESNAGFNVYAPGWCRK